MATVSGQNTAKTSGKRRRTSAAHAPQSSRRSSSQIRSGAMSSRSEAQRCMAASVSASGTSPRQAEKRRPRRIRSASSRSRSSAVPTQRKIPLSRSFLPPNGSRTVPRRSIAMALTVKSRRRKSSVSESVNVTVSGRR